MKQLFIKFNTYISSSAPVKRLFSYAIMMNIAKCNRLSNNFFQKMNVFNCKYEEKVCTDTRMEQKKVKVVRSERREFYIKGFGSRTKNTF